MPCADTDTAPQAQPAANSLRRARRSVGRVMEADQITPTCDCHPAQRCNSPGRAAGLSPAMRHPPRRDAAPSHKEHCMATQQPTSGVWRFDIVAGLTAAAVVLPKAMAYAAVAGLPVAVGLYTAFVPMIVYAVLGTSRVLSVSSTTTLGILTAAELGAVVPNGDPAALMQATALLTLMVGAALVLASVLRLGFFANFISEPVLVGFKAGIAVVIIIDQLPKILGIHFTKGTFLHNVQS